MVHTVERESQGICVNQICFGEHNDTPCNAKRIKNAQVFFGLWFPTFVGRNHKHARVNTANAGEHVAQKTHMARYVNKTNLLLSNLRESKTKVDGESAAFLFFPTVWVGAGKSLNK